MENIFQIKRWRSLHDQETNAVNNSNYRESTTPSADASFFCRKRYYVISAVMVSWVGMVLLRTNLSICLADMTANKTVTVNNVRHIKEAEFNWTSFEKGIILSSFSWGYVLSPIGGLIAPKVGGVRTFGLGIFLTGVVTVLSPVLIKQHFLVYSVGRVFEGLFEGFSTASLGIIFYNWVPPNEKTILTNLSYMGFALGVIVGYPVSGTITQLYNWQITFYATGVITMLWSLFFISVIGESPSADRFIKESEKYYFRRYNVKTSENKVAVPWRKILTSPPLWAYLNEVFVMSWSISFFAYCLPLYIKDVFDVDTELLGWISSAPYYFMIIGRLPASFLADYLRETKMVKKTKVHKMYIFIGQIGAICSLVIAGMTRDFIVSLIVFATFQLLYGLACVSYSVLPLDMGGQHSSFLLGMTTMVASVGNILNPLVIGLMVTNHTSAEWSRYFFFLSSFNVWAIFIFSFWGSGELQTWAVSDGPTVEDEDNMISRTRQ